MAEELDTNLPIDETVDQEVVPVFEGINPEIPSIDESSSVEGVIQFKRTDTDTTKPPKWTREFLKKQIIYKPNISSANKIVSGKEFLRKYSNIDFNKIVNDPESVSPEMARDYINLLNPYRTRLAAGWNEYVKNGSSSILDSLYEENPILFQELKKFEITTSSRPKTKPEEQKWVDVTSGVAPRTEYEVKSTDYKDYLPEKGLWAYQVVAQDPYTAWLNEFPEYSNLYTDEDFLYKGVDEIYQRRFGINKREYEQLYGDKLMAKDKLPNDAMTPAEVSEYFRANPNLLKNKTPEQINQIKERLFRGADIKNDVFADVPDYDFWKQVQMGVDPRKLTRKSTFSRRYNEEKNIWEKRIENFKLTSSDEKIADLKTGRLEKIALDKYVYYEPVTDPKEVYALNKRYGKQASTSSKLDIKSDYNGEYYIDGNTGQWKYRERGKKDFVFIDNIKQIKDLNSKYGLNAKIPTKEVLDKQRKEEDLLFKYGVDIDDLLKNAPQHASTTLGFSDVDDENSTLRIDNLGKLNQKLKPYGVRLKYKTADISDATLGLTNILGITDNQLEVTFERNGNVVHKESFVYDSPNLSKDVYNLLKAWNPSKVNSAFDLQMKRPDASINQETWYNYYSRLSDKNKDRFMKLSDTEKELEASSAYYLSPTKEEYEQQKWYEQLASIDDTYFKKPDETKAEILAKSLSPEKTKLEEYAIQGIIPTAIQASKEQEAIKNYVDVVQNWAIEDITSTEPSNNKFFPTDNKTTQLVNNEVKKIGKSGQELELEIKKFQEKFRLFDDYKKESEIVNSRLSQISKDIDQLKSEYNAYESEKQIVQNKLQALNKRYENKEISQSSYSKQFNDIKSNFESNWSFINDEYIQSLSEREKELTLEYNKIKSDFDNKYSDINQEYLDNLSREGSDISTKITINKFENASLNSALNDINRAVSIKNAELFQRGNLITGSVYTALTGFLKGFSLLSDQSSEDIQKTVSELLGPSIAPEYLSEKNLNWIEQAYYGVLGTYATGVGGAIAGAPAGPVGSAIGMGIALYSSNYVDFMETADQIAPDIPHYKKQLLGGLYGITAGALDRIGIGAVLPSLAKKNLIFSIMKNTIDGIPKNASKEAIEKIIQGNIKYQVIQGGLSLSYGSLGEGLTGALQEVDRRLVNEILDKATDNEYFNNEGAKAITYDVLKNGALEALGGGLMDVAVNTSIAIKDKISLKASNERAESMVSLARQKDFYSQLSTALQVKIQKKELSLEQAKEIQKNWKRFSDKISLVPENLNAKNTIDVVNLMIEKDAINQEISGKDPLLTLPQQARIKEIDEQIKTIGNAVQEPSTEGVLQRQQEGVTETGGERGGVEPIVQGQEVAQEGEATAETKAEEVVPVAPTPVPGEKATIADVDIIYPTEPQAEERRGVRSTNEYVEKASESLPVEDVEILAKELEGDFGLLTAENPMAQPLTEEENQKLNEKAVEWLSERGYNPRPVTGKYGQAENSFFVPGLKRQDAIDFAKQFNQEAVAHSDGLVYQDGSMNPRVKENDNFSFKDSYTPDSDFVSIVKTPEGLKTFVVGYNFDEKVMPEQQAAPTQVAQEVTITPETRQTVTERINKETDTKRKKVFTAVQKVLSAIPNAKVILHDNTDAFVAGVAKSAGITNDEAIAQGVNNNRGSYVNGEIHINLEKAGVSTVFHEAFHDLLAKKGMENNALLDMAKGLKSVISDKALKQRLDEFVSNYEEGDRAEEYTTELGAIMSKAQKELYTTKLQRFKTLVNKIAKKLGLPVVFSAASTAQDAVDFMNSMAGKLGKGEQIEVGEYVENPIGVIKAEKTFGSEKNKITVVYAEQDKIDELIKKGLLEQVDNIHDIGEVFAATTSPDDMLAGAIFLNDKKIADGYGGIYFVTMFNDVWASSNEKIADQIAKRINKSLRDNPNNKGYLFLVKGSDAKLISSPQGATSSLKVLESMVQDGLISASDFRSAINQSMKDNPDTKAKINLQGNMSLSDMIMAVDSLFDDVKKSSFDNRGTILKSIIINLGNTESVKKNDAKIKEFLRVDKNNKLGWSKTSKTLKTTSSVLDLIANISREDITRGLNNGDIYAAIEVNGEVEVKPGDHKSYPFHIKTKDGSSPKLILFKNRKHGRDVLSSENNETSEELGASFDGKVLGTASNGFGYGKVREQQPSKIKAQKVLPESVEKRLTEDGNGNYVFHHYSRSKRDSIKPTTGDGSFMVSKEEASALASVNGVAQYYTMADQVEQGVGEVQHTVVVPMDEVYYLQDDKLNLYDKAKEEFQKARPGQAFSPNYQAAWIGKVANDMGYKMLVSEWRNGELRAQTTLELKPETENIEMKPREVETFKVGDKVNVFGEDAVITEMNGDIASYKGERSSGTINVVRSKQSIKKISSIKAQKENTRQNAIDDAKAKYDLSVTRRRNPHQQGVDAALNDLRKSDWYKSSDDTQRENAERELKKFFGEKLKSAPSVEKVLGKKPQPATFSVSDLGKALRDQLKNAAKIAREAKKAIYDSRKSLNESVKEVLRSYKGKISLAQARAILNKSNTLNLLSPEKINQFINYVERVAQNANYAEKVNKAEQTKRRIRRNLKNAQAENKMLAKNFLKIDPLMVEDIDDYNSMADSILGSIAPSRIVKGKPQLKTPVEIASLNDNINYMLYKQEESMKKSMMSSYRDLVDYGVISGDMTYAQMQDVINKIKQDELVEGYNEDDVNNLLDSMFNDKVIEISEMGVTDPNGIISRIQKANIDGMSIKDKAKLVEMLDNFLVNFAVGGLDSVLEVIEGNNQAKNIYNSGKKARPIKYFFSKTLGNLRSIALVTAPEMFNLVFGGVVTGTKVMDRAGFGKVILGANKARNTKNALENEYAEKFGKQKNFWNIDNTIERGMVAFLSRFDKQENMQSELNRRVEMINSAIETLKKGTKEEQKLAKTYQLVADRLNINSVDRETIFNNAKTMNKDAVGWMMDKWADIYGDLSFVSLSVYNTMLSKDQYYTTDRYKKTEMASSITGAEEIPTSRSSYVMNSDTLINKTETGVLMPNTKPSPSTIESQGRYIDLSFEMNNFSAMEGALVDIETAAAIRRVDAFMNSKYLSKVITDPKDLDIIKGKVSKYIASIKNRSVVSNKQYQKVLRDIQKKIGLNFLGKIGYSLGLGSIFQPIMQTVPVVLNTALQAGPTSFIDLFRTGSKFQQWLNKSGAGVSNRGQEAVTAIESADSKIKTFENYTDKISDGVSKFFNLKLKYLLSKPDIWVARGAFLSYYKQYLEMNNIDSSKINWDTWDQEIKDNKLEDINKEAILYADSMVNRNQNVSDERLAGELLSSQDEVMKIIRKTLFPYASFSINSRAKIATDVATIYNLKQVDSKDRAIAFKSLVGTLAEQATFHALNMSRLFLLGTIASLIYGDDDDETEEERKKRMKNASKFPVKSLMGDLVSPAPVLDEILVDVFDMFSDDIPFIKDLVSPTEKEVNDAVNKENERRALNYIGNAESKFKMNTEEERKFREKYLRDNSYKLGTDYPGAKDSGKYGLFSVGYDQWKRFVDRYEMATTGEYIVTDQFGNTTKKYLGDQDKNLVKLVYFIGDLPAIIGGSFKEGSQISNKIYKKIEENSYTYEQYGVYKEFKKRYKREPQAWESMLIRENINFLPTEQSKKSITEVVDYIKDLGGFTNKEGKEFVKALGKITESYDWNQYYKMIKSGKKYEDLLNYSLKIRKEAIKKQEEEDKKLKQLEMEQQKAMENFVPPPL